MVLASIDPAFAASTSAPHGGGFLADLARDGAVGLSLLTRQMAEPLRSDLGVAPLALGLGLAALILTVVRTWLLGRIGVALVRHRQSPLAVYGRGTGAIVVTALCFTVAGFVVLGGLNATLFMLPEVTQIAYTALAATVMAGLGAGVGRALRSPDAKELRPVSLPPGLGRTIGVYPFAAGLMLAFAGIIDQISRTLGATATSWTIAQGGLVVTEFVLIARFLIQAGRARERQVGAAAQGDAASLPAVFGITGLAWGALLLAAGALVFGHTRFAMTLLQEMLWAGLVVATAWIVTRFADALVARLLGADRAASRFATGVVGVGQPRIEQAALLLTALLNTVVWLFALSLVLAPLQGSGNTVVQQLRPSPMLESLRSLNLSPRTLLVALGVLVGGVATTRLVRGWLERRFLPTTSLDIGARTSITTGLSYVGIIVALLATSASLGLQLEKITLIASALTVGIGFGLQAIIQNFVSGVILLFERPVKTGDWVSVTGSEGRVRRMRVRATEVVADDGSIAIVPNSAFVSSTVLNRAGVRDRSSFDLTVRVAGCPTPTDARRLLLDRIATSDAIRADPAPRAYLETLGDGVWTFRIRMQPTGSGSQASAVSDLLFHLSALNADGVTILVGTDMKETEMPKAIAAAVLAAAAAASPAQQQTLRPSFLVTSPTYPEFAFLDRRSAASERDCGGRNLSPALAWSGEPGTTRSFAVYFQDPDGTFGQGEGKWIGYNIAPDVHSLGEGGMSGTTAGATVGLNDHDEAAYYGPCPPYGTMHHYVYGVYALDLPVGALRPGLNKVAFLKAIKGHTVAYQSIVFHYQRPLPANGVIPAWTPRKPKVSQ